MNHASTRSFDSVNGLASESIHSAQDDRVEGVAQEDNAEKMKEQTTARFFALVIPLRLSVETWY